MAVKVIRDVGEKWARGGKGRGSSWLLMYQARGPGPSSIIHPRTWEHRSAAAAQESGGVAGPGGAFLLCNVRSQLHVDTHLAHP